MSSIEAWMLFILFALLLFAAFCHWLLKPGLREGDVFAAIVYRFMQIYARLFHHLQIEGTENIPSRETSGRGERPLIVIANHTAGVDPVLVQASLPFESRWMMAQDMRVPQLEPIWKWVDIIFIDRHHGDATGIRRAIAHLKNDLSLGIFPEGFIERPPRRILPFQPGVGMLIRRSRSLVLPIIIEGTPFGETAWESLMKGSHSRVRILPVIDYAEQKLSAQEIASDLNQRYLDATGWPAGEAP